MTIHPDILHSRRQAIEAAHRSGADGPATALALTALMDDLLCDAFAQTPADADVRSHVALIALGGYGRRELSPHSDVDIMLLCRGGDARAGAERFAAALLRNLWDAGLTIGHSVRTIDDVREIHGRSVESWTALLEGRRVCGAEHLERELWECLAARSANHPDPWMLAGILASAAARHDRFGHSVKLLEPNIKKSAGGLRDLHTVLWLVRSTSRGRESSGHAAPACRELLDELLANGTLDTPEHDACAGAFAFLLRTRHAMHYARGNAHDTLEYALQRDLAEQLGYGPRKDLHSVEVFMREYHLHARTIHRLVERMLAPYRSGAAAGEAAPRRCDPAFVIMGDRLVLDPPRDRLPDAATILDAFVHVAEYGVAPDGACGTALTRSLDLFTAREQASPALADRFRRIIRGRHPAAALRAMNDLGVLGAFLPEFGELVAFYQHSVYHYYTADEHTIIALEHAAGSEGGGAVVAEAFRRLPQPEVLYMSVLLHDIGKARGVADHEHTGAVMAEEILTRLGWSELAPDVAFLVRHHLLMEQTAFRRNIHDPSTVREFAARCGTLERLDLLTVLTYADLSAVNARVWTGWKASLLGELHTLTAAALRTAGGPEHSDDERHGARVQTLVDRLGGRLPHEEVRSHLEGIPGRAYVASFTEEEIARHIAAAGGGDAVTALFADQEGYTDVTVVARDAPFLLARCCAVLAAHDANIFDATIFTRDDGVVIDRFRVFDAATHGPLPAGDHEGMTADLRAMLAGTLDAEHLFAAHRRRWRRRRKPPHGSRVRTDVEFEEASGTTIIDVYAPDALGLLYRITTAMSRLDLDIVFAKIATRADGVADAFYVRERTGGRLEDPTRRAAVREALLQTIRATTEEELA